MKQFFISAALGAVLIGCASTETHDVRLSSDGTTVYGLDDQPNASAGGTGSLMPGAYENRQMQTGQFTGKERTHDYVGQRITLPREADPRALAHDDSNTETGAGAGTLGQTGIVPGRSVSTSTIMRTPGPTPPQASVTPPGAEVLEPTNNVPPEAVGQAPGVATGNSETNNPPAEPALAPQ